MESCVQEEEYGCHTNQGWLVGFGILWNKKKDSQDGYKAMEDLKLQLG